MISTVIFGGGHWTCSKCKRTISGSSIDHDCNTNLFIQNKMIQVTINEVKKDLYKSKVNAKFSHYAGGKLYYNVELSDGRIYQFPISSVIQKPSNIYELIIIEHGGNISQADNDMLKTILGNKNYHSTKLAEDLGNTAFGMEIKASELNRWINKAMESGDFICINKAPELVETYDERSNPAGIV